MEINESRSDHLAVNIDRPHGRLVDPRTDADDRIPADRNIPAIPRAAGAVDDPAVPDEQIEGRLLAARWSSGDSDQQANDDDCNETAHERLLLNALINDGPHLSKMQWRSYTIRAAAPHRLQTISRPPGWRRGSKSQTGGTAIRRESSIGPMRSSRPRTGTRSPVRERRRVSRRCRTSGRTSATAKSSSSVADVRATRS